MSEFGKGLTYCIGLFLAHAERKKTFTPDLWFNGASDHLYEMVVPDSLPDELRGRLEEFQRKCLHWGHGFSEPDATEEDKQWAIKEAKELLRLIDEAHGIETQETDYS